MQSSLTYQNIYIIVQKRISQVLPFAEDRPRLSGSALCPEGNPFYL